MSLENICPACGAKISLGRVLRATTPFHLSCGECGIGLGVRGPLATVPLTLAILLGCAGGAAVGLRQWTGAALALLLLVLLELVASYVVVRYAKLEARAR